MQRRLAPLALAGALCACAGAGPDAARMPEQTAAVTGETLADAGAVGLSADEQLCAASAPPPLRSAFGRGPSVRELEAVDRVEIHGAVTDESAIRAALGVEPGGAVDPVQVGRGIESIWALGRYQDVAVSVVTAAAGSRTLRVELQPRLPIGRVVLQGGSGVLHESATAALGLRSGELFDELLFWRGRQQLRELYEQAGFRGVELEPHLQRDDAVHVCVRVTEGVRSLIRSWSLTGTTALDDATLAAITDRRGGINARGGVFRPDVWAIDALRVKAWYYDHGYLQVRVGAPVVESSPDGRSLDVAVSVEEGPVFHLGQISFSGARRVPGAKYGAAVESRVGEVFSRSKISEDLERLRQLQHKLAPLGAGTEITPEMALDPARKVVGVEFRIE